LGNYEINEMTIEEEIAKRDLNLSSFLGLFKFLIIDEAPGHF
jgi:hypothetical protein